MVAETEIDSDRIGTILMPYATEAYDRIANGTRFVHYTSAKSALEILQSRCIWMRNATCMNDYNEMRHGLQCLFDAFKTDAGTAFNAALEGCYPELSKELNSKFLRIAPTLIEHTYITCVSEHTDEEELYGRLSMWRAYGASIGVALVLNNGPFVRPSTAHSIWTTPVAYVDSDGVRDQIQNIANHMHAGKELLKQLSREKLLDEIFRTLIFAIVSSKHKAFKEEHTLPDGANERTARRSARQQRQRL